MNGIGRRINVIGTAGSGKTIFSKTIARLLDLKYIELDSLFWKPNWEQPSREEFREKVKLEVDDKDWVVDGNYGRTRDIVWARANTIIWLDYSFFVTMKQVISRTFQRIFYRQELWAGNRETIINSFFRKDSVIYWVLTTFRRRRKQFPALFALPEYQHLKIVDLTSPKSTDHFLSKLSEWQKKSK